MELIKPNFEIWEQDFTNPVEDMYSHIARCIRVCYQSTKKGTESDEEFVKRVIFRHNPIYSKANHLSVLEHGTIYLYDSQLYTQNEHPLTKYEHNKYSKFDTYTEDAIDFKRQHFYVTTNLRVIIENSWEDDLKFICAPKEAHIKRVTVCFNTNIGVSREYNRHRVNSICEESTRYCNYSNEKFGNKIKFAIPAWIDLENDIDYIESSEYNKVADYVHWLSTNEDVELLCKWDAIDFYLAALTFAEWFYLMLIKKGWKPQQAREVLPLATKTQLVHTAYINDWIDMYKLRGEGISGVPHPNASLLMNSLYEDFKKRNYIQ